MATQAEGMMKSDFWKRGWSRWVMFILGWTVLSLLFLPETYLYFLYRGEAIPLDGTLALTLVNAAIALLFLPAIVWLARRFPVDQRHWRSALLVHIPACMAFSLSYSGVYAALCYASPWLFHMLFIRFHPNLLTYWAIVGFSQAMDYFRRYTEREKQLAQAELHLLKAQLHPHFLFNTLHTISAMMHEDVRGADRMVNRLSELLRLALENIGNHEASLRQEIEFLKSYLEIERVRYHENLELALDLAPHTLATLVPSMLLQPLAENSIRHGFGTQRTGGVITFRARAHDGCLLLEFADNGCGLAGKPEREGLGLSNTRRRLEQLYGNAHRFQIADAPGGGALIKIEIPFRTVTVEEPALVEFLADEDSRADRRRRALGAKTDRYAAQV